VLLEDSFYIDSDRVNRTVPKYIDEELYQVFGSLKDVVANTRGLGRRQDSSAKEM